MMPMSLRNEANHHNLDVPALQFDIKIYITRLDGSTADIMIFLIIWTADIWPIA